MLQVESEYVKQAREFMERNGIEFRAVLIGNDCPLFCEDARKQIDMDKVDVFPRRTHIHGKHYRCTLSAKGRGHFAVDFWNSYADEEHNAKKRGEFGNPGHWDWQVTAKARKEPRRVVSAYDVLASITKNDPGSFEDFCGDYRYDEDSRRAEDVYRAVVKEWKHVRRFFTDSELNEARDIQ